MELVINKTTRDYVIIRIDGNYDQHSHFKSKKGATNLVDLLNKNKMPTTRYEKIAAKRLLTKEEYEHLKITKRKQQYFNVGAKQNLHCYK